MNENTRLQIAMLTENGFLDQSRAKLEGNFNVSFGYFINMDTKANLVGNCSYDCQFVMYHASYRNADKNRGAFNNLPFTARIKANNPIIGHEQSHVKPLNSSLFLCYVEVRSR